jgi:hypothetical protein
VDPVVGQLVDHDLGATDHRWECTKVSELTDVAKLGYWGWKYWKWVEAIPI